MRFTVIKPTDSMSNKQNVLTFPQSDRILLRGAELGSGRAVVDGVVVRQHLASEDLRGLPAVLRGAELVAVPRQIHVVAEKGKRVLSQTTRKCACFTICIPRTVWYKIINPDIKHIIHIMTMFYFPPHLNKILPPSAL